MEEPRARARRLARGQLARVSRRRFLTTATAAMGGIAAARFTLPPQRMAPLIDVGVQDRLYPTPLGIGGVGINAHTHDFARTTAGIDFQGDLRAARIKLVRTVAYPDDQSPGHDVVYVDTNVKAILGVGAAPLFVHYIAPGLPYLRTLRADGVGATDGTVSTNLVALVQRYQQPPYNLHIQHWEIGNEPDFAIDYRVSRPAEYTRIFNTCHDALVAAGLRDRVVLCGPAVSAPYHGPDSATYSSRIIDAVLDTCAHSVDVLTYHHYAAPTASATDLLTTLDDLEDATQPSAPGQHGVAALRARMDRVRFARPHVGIGLTEHNTVSFQHELPGGLWNLGLLHHYLYNPRGLLTTAYVFDDYGSQQGGYGLYDVRKHRDYTYWALWINGNLRGSEVLHYTYTPSGAAPAEAWPALLVTATRDASRLYVEVINRRAVPVQAEVNVRGVPTTSMATLFMLAEGILPLRGRPMRLGARFTHTFPALSASIFTWPRGQDR